MSQQDFEPTRYDSSFAEEGYGWRENQGDYIHKFVPPLKKDRNPVIGDKVLGVLLAIAIGATLAAALVTWWSS